MRISLGYICPEDYNPADFYVHTLAIVPGNETECRERVKSLCDSFDANCKSQLEKDNLQDDIDEEDTVDGEFKVSKGKSFKATLWTQLCLLLWRSWLAQIRDPTLVRVKFGQTIFMALLIGLLYLQVSYDARRLQNIAGVIFFVVTNSSLVSLFAVIQTFPMEMPVFLREHGSRLYRTELYFMTKHLSDVPFLIVQTFIYSVIVYWMVGLQDQADKFFTFFGLILLISNVAVGVGYIVSSASSNVSIALALAPVSVIPMMLFGGLFLNVESIPKYFYWVSYLSWFYYGFEALSINEWDGFAAVCSNNTAGCVPDGTTALEFFGFDKANYLQDIAILFALLVAARIVGLLILNLRVYCHDKR
jgi:ABC-type multidrug transport system permease subunit